MFSDKLEEFRILRYVFSQIPGITNKHFVKEDKRDRSLAFSI